METAGSAALNVVDRLTHGRPSSTRSPARLVAVSPPTTEVECRALQQWAESQPARPEAATPDQIAKQLSFLAAALPSRSTDEDSAKKRFVVYQRLLGECSQPAIAHMARRACESLDWFPTPHQCLRFAREFTDPPMPRLQAQRMCAEFWQREFDAFISTLMNGQATQQMVDAKSDRWNRIAMERGFLRLMPDGKFMIRQAQAAA